MRNILFFVLVQVSIYAQNLDYKAIVGIDYKKFDYKNPLINNKNQKTLESEIEIKKDFDSSMAFIKIETLKDLDELNRKYLKLNEVYYKYEDDNYDLIIGKDIKYWGALELNNLSDIYNKKNTQNDPFDKKKKLGKEGFTYTYYNENEDSLSLILSKDKDAKNDIASYIKYSGSRDDIAQRDFSYILSSKNEKFIMYHTLINGNTIYKFEYLYSNQTNNYESGLGFEHTLYNLFDKKDFGLMMEYYKSNNQNIQYQKSLFVGTRLTFNNTSDSDIIAGIINDNNKNETAYSFEYNTRWADKFKTKLSYIKNDSLDLLGINISYYF
jgi:hypothetical protein